MKALKEEMDNKEEMFEEVSAELFTYNRVL